MIYPYYNIPMYDRGMDDNFLMSQLGIGPTSDYVQRDPMAEVEDTVALNLLNIAQQEIARRQAASNNAYIVQAGDSLSRIAMRYGMRPGDFTKLAELNGISDPNRISVGQKLYIPEGWKRQSEPIRSSITTQRPRPTNQTTTNTTSSANNTNVTSTPKPKITVEENDGVLFEQMKLLYSAGGVSAINKMLSKLGKTNYSLAQRLAKQWNTNIRKKKQPTKKTNILPEVVVTGHRIPKYYGSGYSVSLTHKWDPTTVSDKYQERESRKNASNGYLASVGNRINQQNKNKKKKLKSTTQLKQVGNVRYGGRTYTRYKLDKI